MWLLVAVLAAHLGAAAAQAVPVQTGDEFLQALADAARGSGPRTIELQADVALSPGDVAALGLQLPLEMQPGALLEIRGAGEGGRGLDFGGIMDLLLLEPGASLELDNLRINGYATLPACGNLLRLKSWLHAPIFPEAADANALPHRACLQDGITNGGGGRAADAPGVAARVAVSARAAWSYGHVCGHARAAGPLCAVLPGNNRDAGVAPWERHA